MGYPPILGLVNGGNRFWAGKNPESLGFKGPYWLCGFTHGWVSNILPGIEISRAFHPGGKHSGKSELEYIDEVWGESTFLLGLAEKEQKSGPERGKKNIRGIKEGKKPR